MEVSYIFRFSDYDALCSALWTRRGRLIRYTILWLAVLANFYFSFEIWRRAGLSSAWPNFLCGVILLLVWFPGIKLIRRWNLRRLSLEGQPIRIALSDDGVRSSQNHIEGIMTWDAFTRHSTLGRHAFLWINKLQALVIPFDAFKSEADRETFLNFIAARVKPEA